MKETEEEYDCIKQKHNKSGSLEGDVFGNDSFRPIPLPCSPQFMNKKLNYINIKNNNTNKKYINNNDSNFTETIETKIEGNNSNKNSYNEKNINKNISICTHTSNILSLGKMTNKDIILFESKSKNSEDSEEKKEEEF